VLRLGPALAGCLAGSAGGGALRRRCCGRLPFAAYALAALIASLTGILAVSYYGNMDFGGGLVFGVKVLFIAAIGGAGTPLLSALGGAAMGLAETLWSAYGDFLWRDLVIFSALVLLLVIFRRERPLP
jgi:branched-chain amino acid transport system permease protein